MTRYRAPKLGDKGYTLHPVLKRVVHAIIQDVKGLGVAVMVEKKTEAEAITIFRRVQNVQKAETELSAF